MRLATGVLLGARYELRERIAGGGMGEVWGATDQVLGRDVAVKILRREYADDPKFLERFRAEARHTAGLSHAGIAAVYDFGADDDLGSPFLVMERVPGEPLSAVIAGNGAMSPDRTLDVIGQAGLALQAAHDAGVIHRDVKPGNILLTPDGTVKITDFGIARATNSVPLTQTGAIMGTAHYISPEQASGEPVTPASDIYSLGVVAYECLSGRRPFQGNTPVSVALAQVREEPPALPPGVPAPVGELVMRMLAKQPADRPASAGELGHAALALRGAVAVGAGTDAGAAEASGPGATLAMPPVAASDATQVVGGPGGPARGTDAATDPGLAMPPERRRRGWLPFVILLGALLLLALLLGRAFGGSADDETRTAPQATDSAGPSASATTSAPATVTVDEASYVGRPVDDARAELEADGLKVDVVDEEGDGPVGTVKDVSPTGEVEPGTTITLTAVTAGDQGDQDNGDKGPGKGKGKHDGRKGDG